MESKYKKILDEFDLKNENQKEQYENHETNLVYRLKNLEISSNTEIKRVRLLFM